MIADILRQPQTPAFWTKCCSACLTKATTQTFPLVSICQYVCPCWLSHCAKKASWKPFSTSLPTNLKATTLQSQVRTASCAQLLCPKVLIISKVCSLAMQVFQHLDLKPSAYSLVQTASEEQPAKLCNYTREQNLTGIHKTLPQFLMQSSVCRYHCSEAALLLHY